MDLSTFLQQRRPSWKRLEEVLERVEGSGLSALDDDETVEFGRLYRRTASDLNQAQTFVSGDATVRYLNDLVARAYLVIYGKTKIDLWASFWFLVWGWPAVFRWHLGHFLLATVLFFAGAVFAFLACYFDKDTARPYLLPTSMSTILPREEGNEDPTQLQDTGNLAAFSSALFTNNTSVTLIAFAMGITLGVGTAWFMFYNGIILGALGAIFTEAEVNHPGHGYLLTFATGILPHGVLEIPAMLIGGAAGFILAQGMLRVRPWPRTEELARCAKQAFLLVTGAVPLLMAAGMLEAGVARAPDWFFTSGLKLLVASVFGLLFLIYTLLFGWFRNPHAKEAS